jgi:hypothetical protein
MPFNPLETIPQDMLILAGWYVILGCITLAIYLKRRRDS